jgi:hypothetical protein
MEAPEDLLWVRSRISHVVLLFKVKHFKELLQKAERVGDRKPKPIKMKHSDLKTYNKIYQQALERLKQTLEEEKIQATTVPGKPNPHKKQKLTHQNNFLNNTLEVS